MRLGRGAGYVAVLAGALTAVGSLPGEALAEPKLGFSGRLGATYVAGDHHRYQFEDSRPMREPALRLGMERYRRVTPWLSVGGAVLVDAPIDGSRRFGGHLHSSLPAFRWQVSERFAAGFGLAISRLDHSAPAFGWGVTVEGVWSPAWLGHGAVVTELLHSRTETTLGTGPRLSRLVTATLSLRLPLKGEPS